MASLFLSKCCKFLDKETLRKCDLIFSTLLSTADTISTIVVIALDGPHYAGTLYYYLLCFVFLRLNVWQCLFLRKYFVKRRWISFLGLTGFGSVVVLQQIWDDVLNPFNDWKFVAMSYLIATFGSIPSVALKIWSITTLDVNTVSHSWFKIASIILSLISTPYTVISLQTEIKQLQIKKSYLSSNASINNSSNYNYGSATAESMDNNGEEDIDELMDELPLNVAESNLCYRISLYWTIAFDLAMRCIIIGLLNSINCSTDECQSSANSNPSASLLYLSIIIYQIVWSIHHRDLTSSKKKDKKNINKYRLCKQRGYSVCGTLFGCCCDPRKGICGLCYDCKNKTNGKINYCQCCSIWPLTWVFLCKLLALYYSIFMPSGLVYIELYHNSTSVDGNMIAEKGGSDRDKLIEQQRETEKHQETKNNSSDIINVPVHDIIDLKINESVSTSQTQQTQQTQQTRQRHKSTIVENEIGKNDENLPFQWSAKVYVMWSFVGLICYWIIFWILYDRHFSHQTTLWDNVSKSFEKKIILGWKYSITIGFGIWFIALVSMHFSGAKAYRQMNSNSGASQNTLL